MPGSPTDKDPKISGVVNEEIQDNDAGLGSNATETDNGAAASSSAETQDDNKPRGIVDAVRAALDAGKEQSSGSGESEGKTQEAKPPEGEEPKDGEAKPEDLTDEEFKALSVKTQRRIKGFIGEIKTLNTKLEEAAPQLESFRAVQTFVNKAGLTKEDVNTGFVLMDLMKNNPAECLKQITPLYNQLRELVGDVLPQALAERVGRGEISEADARELARSQAAVNLNHTTAAQQEERRKQDLAREQTTAFETFKTDSVKALHDWETRQLKTDPNYSLMQSRVIDAIELEMVRRAKVNNLPKTVKDCVALADEIKKKVTTELQKLLPKKASVTPVHGTGVTHDTKPAPKNIYEAVAQAVGR